MKKILPAILIVLFSSISFAADNAVVRLETGTEVKADVGTRTLYRYYDLAADMNGVSLKRDYAGIALNLVAKNPSAEAFRSSKSEGEAKAGAQSILNWHVVEKIQNARFKMQDHDLILKTERPIPRSKGLEPRS